MKTIKEQILEIDEQKLEIREYKKYKNGKYYSKYYDKNGNLIKETSSFKGKKITIYYIDGLKYYVQKIAGMTLISNENHQYVSITYVDNYEWTGRRYIHKKDILAENEKRKQSLDTNEILNTSEILNANEKTKEQDIVKKQFYFANALNKIKKINHEMNENKKQFLKKNVNNNNAILDASWEEMKEEPKESKFKKFLKSIIPESYSFEEKEDYIAIKTLKNFMKTRYVQEAETVNHLKKTFGIVKKRKKEFDKLLNNNKDKKLTKINQIIYNALQKSETNLEATAINKEKNSQKVYADVLKENWQMGNFEQDLYEERIRKLSASCKTLNTFDNIIGNVKLLPTLDLEKMLNNFNKMQKNIRRKGKIIALGVGTAAVALTSLGTSSLKNLRMNRVSESEAVYFDEDNIYAQEDGIIIFKQDPNLNVKASFETEMETETEIATETEAKTIRETESIEDTQIETEVLSNGATIRYLTKEESDELYGDLTVVNAIVDPTTENKDNVEVVTESETEMVWQMPEEVDYSQSFETEAPTLVAQKETDVSKISVWDPENHESYVNVVVEDSLNNNIETESVVQMPEEDYSQSFETEIELVTEAEDLKETQIETEMSLDVQNQESYIGVVVEDNLNNNIETESVVQMPEEDYSQSFETETELVTEAEDLKETQVETEMGLDVQNYDEEKAIIDTRNYLERYKSQLQNLQQQLSVNNNLESNDCEIGMVVVPFKDAKIYSDENSVMMRENGKHSLYQDSIPRIVQAVLLSNGKSVVKATTPEELKSFHEAGYNDKIGYSFLNVYSQNTNDIEGFYEAKDVAKLVRK